MAVREIEGPLALGAGLPVRPLFLRCPLSEDADDSPPPPHRPFVEAFVGPKRNGVPDPHNTWKPRKPPVLSERAYRLTGIPYIDSL